MLAATPVAHRAGKGLPRSSTSLISRGSAAKGASAALSETDIGLSLERILGGSVPGKVSKSLQFDRAGGFGQAGADFDELARGVDVVNRGGGPRTATLSNGTKINVRPFSSGRRPTLEIDTPGNPVIKVRY